ncbi:MAG: asparaginase [Devosia sp.]
MTANPVLAEAVRGGYVENRHRGSFIVMDSEGRVIASAGDVQRPVFPRSAVKSIQAMAMAETGAIGRFALDDEKLALACASHHGEDVHVAGVTRFLETIGLDATALECGAHAPTDAAAREAMRAAGGSPTALHNNCSGKHAGMLSVARTLGVDTHGYVERDHPVQQAVRRAMEHVLGAPLSEDRRGIDGCSIPTWAVPLESLAHGFARMATGRDLPATLADAAQRVFDAAARHPRLVAGTGHLDTVVMGAFKGRLMQKGGAEGVQCGAIRDLGWGYAIKCDDGHMEASRSMVAQLLLTFARPDAEQTTLLRAFSDQPLRNVRGLEVGRLSAVAEAFAASP